MGYADGMTAKALKEAMRRVEACPAKAQEALAGIDRGLKAARKGRFATDGEVEAVLAGHRRA
jgi:predicted transcriptional regulator